MAVGTSAKDLLAMQNIDTRLRLLLDQARAAKPQCMIEPPLPIADFLPGVEALHDDLEESHDQLHRFSLVETATRDIFYAYIRSTDIGDPEFVNVWNLLDVVLICGDHGKCTPELVCWLLEELLDSQTTHGCRKVFDYLELRRERLAHKDFHKKNLVFLRSCNELLRRLSRAEDAIFCGRVFFFLFQTFPLGDKSSVNLRGEFHVDNTTTFDESIDIVGSDDGERMDVDDAQTTAPGKGSTGGSAAVADGKTPAKNVSKKDIEGGALPENELYPIFWRLQHDFSNPTRLYESDNFASFKQGLIHTLATFKNSPAVVQTKVADMDARGTKRKLDGDEQSNDSHEDMVDNYNPKYLTSRDLFHLELSDLAFQRHILVQALILIDFLLTLTEAAKKKRDALNFPNKSLLYAYTLSEEDAKWTSTIRASITSYLGAIRDGREYFRMIETVLARDKNWIRWKMESCPSIVRGPIATELELAARKGAEETVRPRRVADKAVGAMNLTFLDESNTGGMPLLKTPSRFVSSSIENLVDGFKMDQLDAEMATDEELMRLNNAMANKKWRALRKVRATNLALLDKVESTKQTDWEAALNQQESAASTEAAISNEDEPNRNQTAHAGELDAEGSIEVDAK